MGAASDSLEGLCSLTKLQGSALTTSLVRARHRLGELDTFSPDALVSLLDRLPRDEIHAYSPGAHGPWTLPAVDLGDTPGETIMRAIAENTLWLHVHVDQSDPTFHDVQEHLLAEVAAVVPDLLPGQGFTNLLLSSPGSGVPFHLDTPPGILWHIRGTKRVWVYPALNEDLVPRETLEDLYAGIHREFVEYEPSFDDLAMTFDLQPGDVIAWPQNAPHRITTLDGVNVSLATEFHTVRSERRARLYRANRFLRHAHLPVRSTVETGMAAATKRVAYGIARRFRVAGGGQLPALEAPLTLDSTGNVVPLAEPVPAVFT